MASSSRGGKALSLLGRLLVQTTESRGPPSMVNMNSSTLQQRRSVGNLPVKSNKYIEDFGARRETIEKEFQWDGQTLRRIGLWGLLVPYGIYRMILFEFDSTDAFGSKPKRDLWGSRASS